MITQLDPLPPIGDDPLVCRVLGLCGCGTAFSSTSHGYCRTCKNAYMSDWRQTHRLTPAQRSKANARRTANMAVKRGKLIPQPCEVCGDPKVQKHHDDYSKPLAVRWLCHEHHLEWHRIHGDIP